MSNRTTTRRGRQPSPSWHRRERRARAAARFRLQRGRGRVADRILLARHHGSMPPTQKPAGASAGKTPKGRGKGSDSAPQASKIEFALPQAMITSLQAITSRSTQDLWGTPTSIPGDLSVEQQAQRRASAASKLSKRISGDLKAKEELRVSLQQWMVTIAIHLAGLVQRVRALGEKVDADLTEALREMREALQQQPSITTTEQVTLATDAVGRPIWNQVQEHEVFRVVSALRAFGVVEMPSRAGDLGSEVSFGAMPLMPVSPNKVDTVMSGVSGTSPDPAARAGESVTSWQAMGSAGHGSLPERPSDTGSRSTRWGKRRGGADASRPSKSPRRSEQVPTPWQRMASGRTPEAIQRERATEIAEDLTEQRATAALPASPSLWESAWFRLLGFALDNGEALIGELTRDSSQDAVLPLQDVADNRQDIINIAEELWTGLWSLRNPEASQADAGVRTAAFGAACLKLQEFLNQVRLCPTALGGIRQGTMLMALVTVGNLFDPYSYAPTTAQEWLYPAAVLEHGELAQGHIASEVPNCSDMQILASRRCPVIWEVADDGIAELF